LRAASANLSVEPQRTTLHCLDARGITSMF
jgi:hypothetical protein